MKAGSSRKRSRRAPSADDPPFLQVALHLPTPCWVSDAEGQITWVNDAWLAYTGADVETIRTKGLRGLHDPDVYPQVARKWEAVKAGGLADEMVFPLRGRDGALRPFHTRVTPLRDEHGAITRWFGVNTDISAQAQAEADLRASQEELREVFERAGDGIFITNAEGRLIDINAAACVMTQFSKEELLRKSVWELIEPDDQARLADTRGRDEAIGEWIVRRRDGSPLAVEISSRRLSDGRRIGVARDISARKQAERSEKQALTDLVSVQTARALDAERQLERFWHASRDLFAIVSTKDSLPRLVNERAWKETLGYSAAQLSTTRLMDLVHPEDRAKTLAMRTERSTETEYFGLENRYRRADGEWVWLSWNVVREGDVSYCIARDVTADKLMRESLARSERQFRLLVGGVVDYALFMLSPEGKVTNWNSGAQRIKGYSAEEIVGQDFSVFYTEADRAAGRPRIGLRAAAEQGRFEAEGWRVRKDGTLFWANVVIDAIRDESGALVGFAKITRDITDRKNAELELQRANERLAHAQKLEALGALTGGVAHDFNNLLMVMAGQASLLRQRIGEDARGLRALDAIDMAARRGQDLTRHLLAFARRQRLNPVCISLASRAAALRELLSSSIGPNIAVHVDFPAKLWNVEVDINELELAILNMAVNARDAMPEGGSLNINAKNITLGPGAEEQELRGDFVELTVRDTGVGIPEDILPKVIDPFFTTKPVDKGTGLGLSQVYGFVQQSGGRMTVASRLGEGTTIVSLLPRSQARPEQGPAGEAAETPPASASRSLSILYVEDNPEVADVAAGLLEHLGHKARVVGSASAAIESLEADGRPDLVFSDIVMAGDLDGLALARRIRGQWPDLPVLLTTGYSQTAESIGEEFPILAKPYQLTQLNDALNAAVAARR
jgi:PAS domain S-box-containing protein